MLLIEVIRGEGGMWLWELTAETSDGERVLQSVDRWATRTAAWDAVATMLAPPVVALRLRLARVALMESILRR